MKCTNKFDCLELKPTLNVQSDSIRAKVFNQLFTSFFFVCFYCLFTTAKFFLKFLKNFQNSLYFLRAYICIISTIIFLASLDNDRSTVETSCLTVVFKAICGSDILLLSLWCYPLTKKCVCSKRMHRLISVCVNYMLGKRYISYAIIHEH